MRKTHIKTTMQCYLKPVREAIKKQKQITSVGKNWQDILVLMMKCWLLLPFHPKEGTQQIKVFQSQSYDSFPFQLARTEVIIPTFIFLRRVFFSSVFLKSNVAALFSYNMVQSFDSTNGRNEH